ncbi:LysR family transcriptional regulator [Endozoicomonas sp. G2_1]|uniref:LysR family transcriptional regulator n=1 Tax=Endozoicomonas sp. G2_1 TaxID=2821091 RepID=UPI001ADBC491|nr:LysR family transcriptional regulator [Endozoicomonas sp. G2_1]MBO9491636.1 LysR family transcriptional regulator [Endozoicomonas sp. G2_1]
MDTSSRILLFLDVTERGSFAKVAEHRQIDRSVVSKQIAKLEQELGVRLLNRTTRSFSITGAGNEVLRKARELKSLLDDTSRLAENYHLEPKGRLRVTCSYPLAQQILQPVINDFQQRFPDVEIELYVGDRVLDIVGDGYDLAFRVGELKDSSLVARYLARNRLVLLASPNFLARYGEPQTVEELAELPATCYAGEKFRADYIDYVDDNNQPARMPMNCRFAANEVEIMKLSALAGNCYYLAPAFQIHNEVKSGQLVPFMKQMKLRDFAAIYAVYPHRDLPLRTRLFFEAVKEYVGNPVPYWEQNIPGFAEMYGNPTREQWQY